MKTSSIAVIALSCMSVKEQQYIYPKDKQSAEQQRAKFNRAFGACLEGRGYTVK